MDKEYIEREAVIERLRLGYCHGCYNNGNEIKCRSCLIDDVLGDIEDATAADVQEVRHGEMEHIANFGSGNCFGYCSVCRAEHKADNPTALKIAYRYCRWCGAKLDGKGDA